MDNLCEQLKMKTNVKMFKCLNVKMTERGFSLAEMIVVIAIFGLIIVTVYLIYALNQRVYLAGEDMAEITQNGRVILERMTREIRQAKEIVTELPEEPVSPPNEIIFQDGHLSLVSEEDYARGGTLTTIDLATTASDEADYYKDMFIEITGGTEDGQIRKIVGYTGEAAKKAEIEGEWETSPDTTSTYIIDTSFYYIHYYQNNSNIMREVFTYCYSTD
ncbi:unnamed protein product, partial [marine sediment metagenome]